VIQLRGLRKVYPAGAGGGRTAAGAKPKVAVRGLSFGVPVGEVFGFLGINGAGKSTSMGVLTGETLPTRGTARLAGLDIVTQQPQVRRLVGHCPQFDALIDNLTLREHLLLFARIKGVPEGAVLAETVAASMHELGITEFAHKLAARLSEVHERLDEMGAATAESRASQILFGLGFDTSAEISLLAIAALQRVLPKATKQDIIPCFAAQKIARQAAILACSGRAIRPKNIPAVTAKQRIIARITLQDIRQIAAIE
jgi:ABC-type lipopolysaccharide export system ATPase subunit